MYYYMTIDIHKAITSNPISKNLLKPWGSNSNPNSLRGKLFNRYTGPGNTVENKSLFTHIRVKYTKFMIYHQVITIDAVCYMTQNIQ